MHPSEYRERDWRDDEPYRQEQRGRWSGRESRRPERGYEERQGRDWGGAPYEDPYDSSGPRPRSREASRPWRRGEPSAASGWEDGGSRYASYEEGPRGDGGRGWRDGGPPTDEERWRAGSRHPDEYGSRGHGAEAYSMSSGTSERGGFGYGGSMGSSGGPGRGTFGAGPYGGTGGGTSGSFFGAAGHGGAFGHRESYGSLREGRMGYGGGGSAGPFGQRGEAWGDASSGYGDSSGPGQRTASGPFRGRGPKGYQRSDERIREDICDRLADDPHLDASGMEVRVQDGEVILEGNVDERRMKHRIEDMCDSVSGVKDVRNNMRVQRGGEDEEESGGRSRSASGKRRKEGKASEETLST